MAKNKVKFPSVIEAAKSLKNSNLKPVYYFFGEDSYSLDSSLKLIEKSAAPFLTSDFDKELYYGRDKNLSDILAAASTFPFGSEKKLIIFKEFEKVKDKKGLSAYAGEPQEFTILVLIHNGDISNPDSEPYKTLLHNNFIFEAKELKGKSLAEWLIDAALTKNKILPEENAYLLIDIIGENRSILEAQLDKIITFTGDKKEISREAVTLLSSTLKEYNIFDLQNALGKKEKTTALKIAMRMLDCGAEPVYLVFMLTRYFTALSRINEITQQKIPDQAAARIVGTHPYYFKDYLKARDLYSDNDIYNAVKALLKADTYLKTASIDNKTIITILITEILQ